MVKSPKGPLRGGRFINLVYKTRSADHLSTDHLQVHLQVHLQAYLQVYLQAYLHDYLQDYVQAYLQDN